MVQIFVPVLAKTANLIQVTMHSQRRFAFLIAILLICLAAAGCTDTNDDFIQGSWTYRSDHLAEIVSESDLIVTWFFSRGTFTYQACCFNLDIEVGGRYRIIESTEDRLTIELYNTYGSGNRFEGEVLIKIDRANNELNIQGDGPFQKLGP